MKRNSFSITTGFASKLATVNMLLFAVSIRLHAAAAGNLPWEKPIQTIATSLTGPVAYAIGLIGIAIAAQCCGAAN